MKIIADSNQAFSVLDLDTLGAGGLDLSFSEAFDLLRNSAAFADSMIVTWSLTEGFRLGGDSLDGEVVAANAAEALSCVESSLDDLTFVVAIDFAEIADSGEKFRKLLGATAKDLEDGLTPGKRLVLVVKNRGSDEPSSASLASLPAGTVRIDYGEMTIARGRGTGIDEFVAALEEDPPVRGEWSFSDPKWAAFISDPNQLDTETVRELVGHDLHLKSAARVRAALSHMQNTFIRRDHELEMMVACALARVNMVFLGPPGTAKSLMVRSFAQQLGVEQARQPIARESDLMREASHKAQAERKADGTGQKIGRQASGAAKGEPVQPPQGRRMFEYLLTRYTTPEEIFGAIDVDLLIEAGLHARRSAGMLPQAEVAFLDEIFKANSAILNTLLSIINEKTFYNMGQAFQVGLAFVIGASNETPDDDELAALYDRFPIRVPCLPVEADLLGDVIRKAHAFAVAPWKAKRDDVRPAAACLNDIRFLSRVVQEAMYGAEKPFQTKKFEDEFTKMVLMLREEYGISDRTPSQLLRVCRALALLEEGGPASELGPEHLRCWGYVSQRLSESRDLQRLVATRIGNTGYARSSDLFTHT